VKNSGPRSASPIGLGAEITDHTGVAVLFPISNKGKDTLQRWV